MTEYETSATWALPFGERAELEFESDHGAFELVPLGPGEQPRIEATGRYADRLNVQVRREGNVVHVEIDHEHGRGRFSFGRWDARVVLYVPPEITARVQTDAGRIDARDLGPCQLALETDAGQIRLHNVRGRLRLSTDAGQIRGEGLRGSFEVETDAGQIRLGILALDPGEHYVSTDVGSVDIELAPGLDVKVETRAGVGSVRSNYPSRPDAPAVLRASTGMGSVRVREAGSDRDAYGTGRFKDKFKEKFEREWGFRPGPRPGFERGWGFPPAPPTPPPPPPPGWRTEGGPRPEAEAPPPAGGETEAARPARPADAEVERILKMVEAGELSARDADELLRALEHE